jgi:hypothetical protein
MLSRSKENHEMLQGTADLSIIFVSIFERTLNFEEKGVEFRPVCRVGGKTAMLPSEGML